MKKAIVTTTINKPTEAIMKFCEIAREQDWKFFIIGDQKTPHELYVKLEDDNVEYWAPQFQEKHFSELSEALEWNTIQRRNIGFIVAYNWGADVIATVDDDNIPLEHWGENLYVNTQVTTDVYEVTGYPVFDPLSVSMCNNLWHRGYPIELLSGKNDVTTKEKETRTVLVQADLWTGDPDIDAICRIAYHPQVHTLIKGNFYGDPLVPFNSQNTFLSRTVFPTYFLFPGIGRMDDIWASYILQYYFPQSVLVNEPTVYQKRNEHDLYKDLEAELIGYRNTLNLLNHIDSWSGFIPQKSYHAYQVYKGYFR